MPIEAIKNTIANAVLPGKTAKKDAVDHKSQTAGASSVMDDTVSLTSMSKDLKDAGKVDQHDQLVNESRVATIKAAIQNGSYVLDHDRLAQKMLNFELNKPDTT